MELVTGHCYVCQADVTFWYGSERPGSLISCAFHKGIVAQYNNVQGQILRKRFEGFIVEGAHPLLTRAENIMKDMQTLRENERTEKD